MAANDNSLARSLHDLGLAAWFGGSLMGAVGLNGAAAQVEEPKQRLRVANAGWNRWTPVNLAGIVAIWPAGPSCWRPTRAGWPASRAWPRPPPSRPA